MLVEVRGLGEPVQLTPALLLGRSRPRSAIIREAVESGIGRSAYSLVAGSPWETPQRVRGVAGVEASTTCVRVLVAR
jgi:hypothetical protein